MPIMGFSAQGLVVMQGFTEEWFISQVHYQLLSACSREVVKSFTIWELTVSLLVFGKIRGLVERELSVRINAQNC